MVATANNAPAHFRMVISPLTILLENKRLSLGYDVVLSSINSSLE
jgi:hypothetical protein